MIYRPIIDGAPLDALYELLPDDCAAVQFPGVANYASLTSDQVVPATYADQWEPLK